MDVLKYDNEINTKHNKSRLSNDVVEVVDLVIFSSLVKLKTYKKKTTYRKKMFCEQVLNEREKYKKLQSWKKKVSLIYETHASCIEVKSSQLWTQYLQLRIGAWKI